MFQQDNWSVYRKKRPPVIRKPHSIIYFSALLQQAPETVTGTSEGKRSIILPCVLDPVSPAAHRRIMLL